MKTLLFYSGIVYELYQLVKDDDGRFTRATVIGYQTSVTGNVLFPSPEMAIAAAKAAIDQLKRRTRVPKDFAAEK